MSSARHATHRESVAFTVIVTVLVALGALVILGVLALQGAPAVTLFAVLLAALPVGPLIAAYMWLDRYEPEPKRLLVAGLLWGAFAATASAIVIGGVGGYLAPITDHASLAIVGPATEEATKGAFLLFLLWWRRAELDGVLDGLVYAGMIGIGFAFTENVLYLSAAYDGTDGMGPGGLTGVTATFVLRCLVSPFAHPLFTAFTGLGVGLAVASRSSAARRLAPLGGYALACLAHGVWNASTIFGISGFAGVYLILMAPALVGLGALALWARGSESAILATALDDAARRELIPATDIGWVVDLRARRAARAFAARAGGAQAAQQMAEYQQAVIELGFLHHRLLRGTPPSDWRARGAEHVARIRALRPDIAFPGQVVPAR